MNVRELIEKVKDLSLNIPIVKTFDDTDPYSYWNSDEVKYGSVIFAVKGATLMDNTIRYSCLLYYGDRLSEDESNANNIYVDAERVIIRIVDELRAADELIEVITASPIINYFRQRFLDNLAGGYVNFTVEVPLEAICDWTQPEPEQNNNNAG